MSVFKNFETKDVCFVMLVSRSYFLMVPGSESVNLGLQNQAFDMRSDLFMFVGSLGTNFVNFRCFRDRLKIS